MRGLVRRWTTGEVRRALQWKAEGNTHKDIAERLGRNVGSVSSLFRDEKRRNNRINQIIAQIEKEASDEDIDALPSDEVESSAKLRKAVLRALLRWADCNGTTVDQAAKFLLSGENPPVMSPPNPQFPQQPVKNQSFAAESGGA